MRSFTETVMPTHTNMHADLAKLIAAGNRIDSASRALTGGEPIPSHLPKWSGPRRDLCFLVGKRASLLAPHEACTAWQVLSLKIQAMEEMDIPKFRDLLAAVRSATIVARQHTIKTAAHSAALCASPRPLR